jgi:N-ethylmaleimide reductase
MSYLQQKALLTTYRLGDLELKNRIVMASLTRGRAVNEGLVPTDAFVTYYAQRASAGLILAETTWVSKRGVSFVNIPGIYSEEQVAGWKKVTDAVHAKGGKIFLQAAHAGAVSHPDFQAGELPVGPSAINPQEQVFTPEGMKETVVPRALTKAEIRETIAEFRLAAENTKRAGFDGIELHAQLFTLIPQFLSAATNQRTDEYGGSIENRSRLLFEVLDVLIEVFTANRVGIKFKPAAFNEGILKPDAETIALYTYLLEKLGDYKLAYVQVTGPVDELKGTPVEAWQENFFEQFRELYKGALMVNGGFTWKSGNAAIDAGTAELVSFGLPYIANPDLVERFDQGIDLAEANPQSFYMGGDEGYIDYPAAVEVIERGA